MKPLPYAVAAITGASTGIGRAVACELARRGVAVALISRRQELLDQVAAGIREEGGTALPLACDVTDRGAVEDALGRVREELGPIDLLFANAGISTPRQHGEYDVEGVETVYRVNVMGTVYPIYAVLPEMIERGSAPRRLRLRWITANEPATRASVAA